MEIAERVLQVRGKLNINNDLENGQDVTVTVTVDEISDKDLNNGAYRRTYKALLFAPEEFDGVQVEYAKDQRASVLTRNALFGYWNKCVELNKTTLTFNKFYEGYMNRVVEEINTKKEGL